jgi:hypothetical protein
MSNLNETAALTLAKKAISLINHQTTQAYAVTKLLESRDNSAAAVYIHTNGGTAETIKIHADQGTSTSSINIVSDVGSVTTTTVGPAAGSGFTNAEVARWIPLGARGVTGASNVMIWQFLVDLTGLYEGGTAGDIIGDNGEANAHFGRYTTDIFGTLYGVTVDCLEEPAGGSADVDIYSATVGTGAEDSAISSLTETQLINHGGWSAGDRTVLTTIPAANEYLYFVSQGTGNTAYTAGRFLLTFYGTL